jgi:hypothetical protein
MLLRERSASLSWFRRVSTSRCTRSTCARTKRNSTKPLLSEGFHNLQKYKAREAEKGIEEK